MRKIIPIFIFAILLISIVSAMPPMANPYNDVIGLKDKVVANAEREGISTINSESFDLHIVGNKLNYVEVRSNPARTILVLKQTLSKKTVYFYDMNTDGWLDVMIISEKGKGDDSEYLLWADRPYDGTFSGKSQQMEDEFDKKIVDIITSFEGMGQKSTAAKTQTAPKEKDTAMLIKFDHELQTLEIYNTAGIATKGDDKDYFTWQEQYLTQVNSFSSRLDRKEFFLKIISKDKVISWVGNFLSLFETPASASEFRSLSTNAENRAEVSYDNGKKVYAVMVTSQIPKAQSKTQAIYIAESGAKNSAGKLALKAGAEDFCKSNQETLENFNVNTAVRFPLGSSKINRLEDKVVVSARFDGTYIDSILQENRKGFSCA